MARERFQELHNKGITHQRVTQGMGTQIRGIIMPNQGVVHHQDHHPRVKDPMKAIIHLLPPVIFERQRGDPKIV
jgi:hypothetical protein